jgi:hypothetical protein
VQGFVAQGMKYAALHDTEQCLSIYRNGGGCDPPSASTIPWIRAPRLP